MELRKTALKQWHAGKPLDCRGVVFDAEALSDLDLRSGIGPALFEQAEFLCTVDFSRRRFLGKVWLDRATFKDRATFANATFETYVSFGGGVFAGDAVFDNVTFMNSVNFNGIMFLGDASFSYTDFQDDASFEGSHFIDRAYFAGAHIHREANFVEAFVGGTASFASTIFDGSFIFAPAVCLDTLYLYGAVVRGQVEMVVATRRLIARNMHLHEGASMFRIRYGELDLAGVKIDRPTILAPIELTGGSDWIEGFSNAAQRLGMDVPDWAVRPSSPRLLSLRNADVAHLTVVDVDMTACRLVGAHHLAQLGMDGQVEFSEPPGRWHAYGLDRLGRKAHRQRWWRYTRRRVVVEEQQLRRGSLTDSSPGDHGHTCDGRNPLDPRSAGWYADYATGRTREDWSTPWLRGALDAGAVDAGRIAATYRELRVGRDRAGDAPRAADFYYGEMEMRRSAAREVRTLAGRIDWFILSAYWMTSGYALRAWRALAWLACLTAVAVTLLASGGFESIPPQPLPTRLDLAFGTALDAILFRTTDADLTASGEWVVRVTRVCGPLLLGLAILSVRGRVKR